MKALKPLWSLSLAQTPIRECKNWSATHLSQTYDNCQKLLGNKPTDLTFVHLSMSHLAWTSATSEGIEAALVRFVSQDLTQACPSRDPYMGTPTPSLRGTPLYRNLWPLWLERPCPIRAHPHFVYSINPHLGSTSIRMLFPFSITLERNPFVHPHWMPYTFTSIFAMPYPWMLLPGYLSSFRLVYPLICCCWPGEGITWPEGL